MHLIMMLILTPKELLHQCYFMITPPYTFVREEQEQEQG